MDNACNGARTMSGLEALKEGFVGTKLPQRLLGKLMLDEGQVPVTTSGYANATNRTKGQVASVVCET
jgi:hypothetical protein